MALNPVHQRYVADRLAEVGQFGTETLVDVVRRHDPSGVAFVAGPRRLTWQQYDERSDRFAALLVEAGLKCGERVAVLLPDGILVHLVYLAALKAGVVVVGIGPRAGMREIRHLLAVSGATALVSHAAHRGEPLDGLVDFHVVLAPESDGSEWPAATPPDGRALGLGEIHLLNSTSGTTGMPKCVVHNQNRWMYYHELAVEAGAFTPDDVFLTLIPAPYGFAQWTANFTPTLLGCPTVVMPRFSAAGAIELIERERVTVVCCVSTQFIMMLNEPSIVDADLSSLRCMFTGGEAVPFERAAAPARR